MVELEQTGHCNQIYRDKIYFILDYCPSLDSLGVVL